MKATLIFGLMALFIMAGCVQQKSAPLQGAWQMVYGKVISGDTLRYEIPGNVTASQIKIWSKNHFVFSGRFQMDTTAMDNYGGGTYTLDGNRYEEKLLYYPNQNSVGNTVKMIMEVKGDSLIQTYPVDDNGEIDKGDYRVEKYVRRD